MQLDGIAARARARDRSGILICAPLLNLKRYVQDDRREVAETEQPLFCNEQAARNE